LKFVLWRMIFFKKFVLQYVIFWEICFAIRDILRNLFCNAWYFWEICFMAHDVLWVRNLFYCIWYCFTIDIFINLFYAWYIFFEWEIVLWCMKFWMKFVMYDILSKNFLRYFRCINFWINSITYYFLSENFLRYFRCINFWINSITYYFLSEDIWMKFMNFLSKNFLRYLWRMNFLGYLNGFYDWLFEQEFSKIFEWNLWRTTFWARIFKIFVAYEFSDIWMDLWRMTFWARIF
jgi:hypothetical protein